MSELDILAGTPQKTVHKQRTENGVRVIPYDARQDADSARFLPWFWERLVSDGLVSLYYPGQESTGFSHFVTMFSGGANIALVTTQDSEGKPDKAIGFVSWTMAPLGAKQVAIAGFIFFKEFWDHKHSTDAAYEIMQYWFTETELDVVLGVVASENIMANRFLSRIGWEKSGSLPGCHLWKDKECDATLWTVTKSDWMKGEQ